MKSTIFAVFLALFITCGFFSNLSGQKIGFSLANQYAERWIKEKEFFTQKVTQLGGEVLVEIADDNSEKQLAQANKLINAGVKVLVVVSVDCAANSKIVEAAHKAGVKVIAYDRLILNSDLDYYISFNSVKIGEILAQYVIKLKPKGNYMFVNGPEADYNSKLIKQGVYNILELPENKQNIKLVYSKNMAEWAEMETYMEVSKFLDESKIKPDAVIAGADVLGVGVINALEERNMLTNTPIVGQDADLQACQGIAKGKYAATILKAPKNLAYNAAELAINVAKGEVHTEKAVKINNGKIDVVSFLIDPILIDKTNLDKEIIESGLISKDKIYEKR